MIQTYVQKFLPTEHLNKVIRGLFVSTLVFLFFPVFGQVDSLARQFERQGSRVMPNNIRLPSVKSKVPAGDGVANCTGGITIHAKQAIQNKFPVVFQAVQHATDPFQTTATPVGVHIHEVWAGDLPDFLPTAADTRLTTTPEAYALRIRKDRIDLWAHDEQAVVNALTTLEFRISREKGLPREILIVDWPDLQMRVLHFPMKMLTVEAMKSAIDRARSAHFNALIMNLKNSVKLKSLGDIAYPYAITPAEFKEVVTYARQSGLEVIPGLNLLTHQNKDFLRVGTRPDLMYNEQTYDPRKPEVFELVYAVIDEIDALIQPKRLHIGHDEVTGHTQAQVDKFGPILPPSLYLKSVKNVHNYLNSKNIETWMWGDMLMIPSEFPEMHKGAFNGTPAYVSIRDSIPRGIVICDWHYRHYQRKINDDLQFPSINLFAEMGFKVLGATWKDAAVTQKFSHYVAAQTNPKILGMIATTWSLILLGASDSDRSDHWAAADAIIQDSGNAFWNAE